jgi:hypothetical protein
MHYFFALLLYHASTCFGPICSPSSGAESIMWRIVLVLLLSRLSAVYYTNLIRDTQTTKHKKYKYNYNVTHCICILVLTTMNMATLVAKIVGDYSVTKLRSQIQVLLLVPLINFMHLSQTFFNPVNI